MFSCCAKSLLVANARTKQDRMSFSDHLCSLTEKTDDCHNHKVCQIHSADPCKETALSCRADFLSKKGIRKKKHMARLTRTTAIVSPLSPSIVPGKSFNVWKRKRKYHSGFMFSGAGARRSAFFPISGGRSVASVTTMPRVTSHMIRSL